MFLTRLIGIQSFEDRWGYRVPGSRKRRCACFLCASMLARSARNHTTILPGIIFFDDFLTLDSAHTSHLLSY